MLPSIKDWLAASWADYWRRWLPLMGVLAVSGLATAFGVLLPVLPAGLAGLGGAGSPWLVWSAAFTVSLLVGLYLSTWGQAAAMRAAANDERAAPALIAGWRQTPAFAWVLSLAMLAAGGGFVLLIVPGLILGVLLFFAPFYQMSGEERGLGALELSFARVRPALGPVSTRLFLAGLIATLPSFIPYLGWLIGPLWAPFGLVACARLAGDLKTLSPAPERPRLGAAVGALSAVFVLASFAVSWSAARAAVALSESYASGRLALPDPETAQSMLAVLQGTGTEEDARRSTTYVLTLSSAPAAAP
jgi:hypothetical protein